MRLSARLVVSIVVGLLGSLFGAPAAPGQPSDSLRAPDLTYAVGVDLSFLKAAEQQGTTFREQGTAKPGLQIFREHGYDWVRLRLFHSPDELPNDLDYTIDLAKAAQERGGRFLLDYHYADSWADPGKQPIPAAWEGLSPEVLADSVYEYTRRTITAFREAGVMPEMVQIGNETRNGMLWPTGKLPDHWDQFAALVKAGVDGVDAGRGQAPRPLIMLTTIRGPMPLGPERTTIRSTLTTSDTTSLGCPTTPGGTATC